MDDLVGLRPLAGGFSGETFLSEVAGERTVVRIYGERSAHRGPAAPEIDAAVLALVRGLVPVPRVLEVRRPDAAAGTPGLLVTEWLAGANLQQRWEGLDDGQLAALGGELGGLVARLAQMPMLRAGKLVDGDLRVEPWDGAADGLVGWVGSHEGRGGFVRWEVSQWGALLELAERVDDLADTVERVSLVHSDLNPKNLLVDPETLALTGVLDWEFAHAGSPYADLGNLLRFHREPAFADAVLTAYVASTGESDPQRVLDLARGADLWALVDLVARDTPEGGHAVTRAAAELLGQVARTGDLHVGGWTRQPGPA